MTIPQRKFRIEGGTDRPNPEASPIAFEAPPIAIPDLPLAPMIETPAPSTAVLDEIRALRTMIEPLYGAFRALLKAREERGTLDLDIAERRVFLGADGHIDRIVPRTRLDSHRLIEEFMIAANVAAAEALEKRRQPCMYRVHDAPEPTRVEALRQFLEGLDLRLAKGQVIRPKHFTRLLDQAKGTPFDASQFATAA